MVDIQHTIKTHTHNIFIFIFGKNYHAFDTKYTYWLHTYKHEIVSIFSQLYGMQHTVKQHKKHHKNHVVE